MRTPTSPQILLGVAVAGVLLFYWRARQAELAKKYAQLTGIQVDHLGRVLGADGKPVADRLTMTSGSVFDFKKFNDAIDAQIEGA